MATIGLSEGMAGVLILGLLVLAAPLPHGVVEVLLSLKPGWVLLVAAASTSLVPLLENAKGLAEYNPRSELKSFESDPQYLSMQVALLRSIVVACLLLAFGVAQLLSGRAAFAQSSALRMEKNLYATQKQAQAASQHSLKMLDEQDGRKEDKVEAILSENVKLKTRVQEAEKELAVVKEQAKGFQREHERLLQQIHDLEKQLDKKPNESKKDK